MYKNLKILAVIPARGGSKGVPRKNLKKILGKSLVEWTIDTAKNSKYIDRYILSSEDDEIIETAEKAGCEIPFKRPLSLAEDDSTTNDVILHALENVDGYDLVVCMQVTSPLVKSEDIDACIETCVETGAKASVSACRPDKSPYWMFGIEKGFMKPVMGPSYFNKRRQALPEVYVPNGAVSVAYSSWFKENKSFYSDYTSAYIMPIERSFDLDTEFDFMVLETFLDRKKRCGCFEN